MSNRVDFFQQDRQELTIPCGRVSVFIEGRLCDYLEVIEIERQGWPGFSSAVMRYLPTFDGQLDIADAVEIGKQLRIEQVYNSSMAEVNIDNLPIFSGTIESINSQMSSGEHGINIIARDFSLELERVMVFGQRAENIERESVFVEGLDTVFNEDGKPNASNKSVTHNGKEYIIFSGGINKKYWSCAEAIHYVLCEYVVSDRLLIPELDQLEALTDGQEIRDVDVTGLDLLSALRKCCDITGIEFKFVTSYVGGHCREAIVFYRKGYGREIELNRQQIKERLNLSKTDVFRSQIINGAMPVTNKYIGQGDFKVYEATFELIKGWDPALESIDYDKYSASTNPEFYQVKNVFRRWVLNETGDYSVEPFNQGEAFDFTSIFEGSNYVAKNRRFWPALTTDKQGRSLGYFLEVSYDSVQWQQYLSAFNILFDECGIWLSSDQLDLQTWTSLLDGTIKFRITATVVSDQRLSCSVSDGPVNSVIPVKEHLITLPRQFKYRKVTGLSIFANIADGTIGDADEADDTKYLYEYVRKQAQIEIEPFKEIRVQMPYVVLNHDVGDLVICSALSKDWLGCKRDDRSKWQLKKVRVDFAKQCTELEIVGQRSYVL